MPAPSILYSIFRLRGCIQDRIEGSGREAVLHAHLAPNAIRCPKCRSASVRKAGTVVRRLQHGANNGRPTFISLTVQRVYCAKCETTTQVTIPFAMPHKRYTHEFARYAVALCKHMTMEAVGRHLAIDGEVIKEIQKAYLKQRFANPKLRKVKRIAIDEIYTGRKSKFITLVLDLDTGAVVYIHKGKDAHSLDEFWKKLKKSGAKIEAVASDMSPAYRKAIEKNLPNAVHVLDRFHVVKLMNEKISDVRRAAYRGADAEEKKVMKGSRFLLLKNPENLSTEHNEEKQLKDALRINDALFASYYLKEDLRCGLWSQRTKAKAKRFLTGWCRRARASGVRQMSVMASTLETRQEALLAWYDHPISTGALEGTNNKIGAIQRQAFGYRDQEFFHLKIYASHLAKYALVG